MSFQLPLPLSYLLGKHLLGKHRGILRGPQSVAESECQYVANFTDMAKMNEYKLAAIHKWRF